MAEEAVSKFVMEAAVAVVETAMASGLSAIISMYHIQEFC